MKRNTVLSLLFIVGMTSVLGAATSLPGNYDTNANRICEMQENKLLVEQVIMKMIAYYGDDLKRTHHALKVHNFARTIAKLEGLSRHEQLTLEIAAVLHDIGIPESERKYNSSAARYQEKEGPPIARELLKDLSLDKNMVERVCFMIGHHHTYEKVDNTDFQILFEADFLVNMYEGKAGRDRIIERQKKMFKTKSGNAILDSMMN